MNQGVQKTPRHPAGYDPACDVTKGSALMADASDAWIDLNTLIIP